MSQIDLRHLADFFAADDLEWKPIAVSKKTGKALAAAYITNRAVQQRFDDIVGPENWHNEFRPGPQGGVVCGISVRVERASGDADWVTKWDGAGNTDIEAVKGGLSDSMRRAAVQWGVGRYLYAFPQQWVPVDDYGKFSQPPRIPREFLPSAAANARADRASERPPERPAPAERPVTVERPATVERAPERSAERPADRSERPPARPEPATGDGFSGGRPACDGPDEERREAPRGFRPVTR